MGYQAQFTLDGNFNLPGTSAWEIGPVRYKFRFAAGCEVTWQTGPPPFSVAPNSVALQAEREVEAQWRPSFAAQLGNTVETNVGGELSGERLQALAAASGNPRRFGQLCLQSLSLDAKLQVPGNRFIESVSLGASLDSDFCFFSAAIDGAAKQFQHRLPVGEIQVRLPVSFTVYFGPSKALWLKLISRLGPTAFRTFVRGLIPSAGAEGAALAGFWTWLGPLSIAVPIAIAIRDLCVGICLTAHRAGLRRGSCTYLGVCYVRTVYGLPLSLQSGEERVRRAAVQLANQHRERYGTQALQRLLERHYFRGRRLVVVVEGQREPIIDHQNVQYVGEQMGEALYAGAPTAIGARW